MCNNGKQCDCKKTGGCTCTNNTSTSNSNSNANKGFKSRFGAPTSGDTFTRKVSDDVMKKYIAEGDDNE